MPELEVTYRPVRGPRRRVRFVEADGQTERVTEEWTGCPWRETGREVVADVQVAP